MSVHRFPTPSLINAVSLKIDRNAPPRLPVYHGGQLDLLWLALACLALAFTAAWLVR
jgi:hypothetical protein